MKYPTNQKVADGLRQQQAAEQNRRTAEHLVSTEPAGAYLARRDAELAEQEAAALLALPDKPEVGTGGELQLSESDAFELPGLVNTVDRPDLVNAQASRHRLELAGEANCLAMAADAAETIQAQNSMEKTLAHQMAAAHAVAMKQMARADLELGNLDNPSNPGGNPVEAARLSNSAARLMDVYQRGQQTLQKLRSNGRQTIVVQHVHVTDGGQAVVAGNVDNSGDSDGGR